MGDVYHIKVFFLSSHSLTQFFLFLKYIQNNHWEE